MLNPQLRLLLFVGVGLAILQAEGGWSSALKLIYFPAVVIFLLTSLYNLQRLDARTMAASKPILVGAGILMATFLATAAMSVFQGEDVGRVVRDFFTYFLWAAAPFIGIDAARQAKVSTSNMVVALFTGLSALGFAVYWLSDRGVGTLGIERLVMYSMAMAGLGVAVGGVYGMMRFNPWWLAFAVFCLVAVLVTGTRTGILIIFGLVGAFGSRARHRVPLGRLVLGFSVLAACSYAVLPLIAARVAERGFLDDRLGAFADVVRGGVGADASGVLRQRALQITMDEWKDHSLFGVGFGHAFENPLPGHAPIDFQLDSAALILAKFGTVGVFFMAVAVLFMVWGIWRFHIRTGVRTEAQTIAGAFVLTCLLLLPLDVPTEDKGLAFATCLVVYLLVTQTLNGQRGTEDWTAMESEPLSRRPSR